MSRDSDDSPAWGTYAPKGFRRFLYSLVRLGLAHGSAKGWFHRRWLSFGAAEPVDITYQGLKLRLHPWDNNMESKLLFGSRSRDRQELRMLMNHLPAAGVFLDIGANIGYYALMAAAHGASRVLAVEPIPAAYERLEFNIRINGFQDRLTAVQVALGAETKRVTLTIVEGDLSGGSIAKTKTRGTALEVQMRPLRDVLAERAIDRVDAMKIDVEGMEDAVLCPFFESAPRSWWPRFVIMEHVHRGNWNRDVLALMLGEGYERIGENRSNVFLRLAQSRSK